MKERLFVIAVAACAALFVAGCGDREPPRPSLTLFVAASLSDVIQEVAAEFEKEHAVAMVCNFAASGALARQLLASPRADLFFSASRRWMDEVEQGGRLKEGTRRTLVSNQLVVIGHRNSPWEWSGPAGLADWPFAFLALGDPDSVPAGEYARTWLESIPLEGERTLWSEVQGRISPAPDVRAALTQVEARADVIGIVYATDEKVADGKVRLIYAVPPEEGPEIEYPVAVLAETAEPELAAAFLEFLTGPAARALFAEHGFRVGG